MTASDFAVMALLLGGACVTGGVLGWRIGNERRDVRAMLGTGAALGIAALAVLKLGGAT